ncbi:MAG: DUF5717 family protein [Oliverpabstia sp.]
MISRYGYEGIKTESLMKLTSYLILDYDFVEQEELVYLAQYVFEQGLYNEVILIYLSDNLLGSVEQMALLWERMRGFQLDTYALEEEILLLSMFGRVYLRQGAAMLEQYVAQKGKEPVILAYISFWAYGYFLGKKRNRSIYFPVPGTMLQEKAGGRPDLSPGTPEILCRTGYLYRRAGKTDQ